jgi:hypothetical protein
MSAMTISQLLQMTKTEILHTRRHLRAQLPLLAEGSPERHDALQTLENIEIVLARPLLRRARSHLNCFDL